MQPRSISHGIARTGAGEMTQYVTVLQENPERDYEGEFLAPLQLFQTWAAVTILQGKDLEKAQEVVAEVTHKVIINYPDIPVESNMYVQLQDGRTFVIQARQDMDERKYQLTLLCLERNDGLPGEQ
jgi:SPP1 family predicted phage head-tail adaptor